MSGPTDTPTKPSLTVRGQRVLDLAAAYAVELGHDYVGTEHILVGLLREGEGIGAGVLESLSVQQAKVEAVIEFIVGREAPR